MLFDAVSVLQVEREHTDTFDLEPDVQLVVSYHPELLEVVALGDGDRIIFKYWLSNPLLWELTNTAVLFYGFSQDSENNWRRLGLKLHRKDDE